MACVGCCSFIQLDILNTRASKLIFTWQPFLRMYRTFVNNFSCIVESNMGSFRLFQKVIITKSWHIFNERLTCCSRPAPFWLVALLILLPHSSESFPQFAARYLFGVQIVNLNLDKLHDITMH